MLTKRDSVVKSYVVMMKPKVTVGMCCRNCESYVKHAIASVANQDFPHELMEILFVDDGSTDSSADIAKVCLSKTNIAWRIVSSKWRGIAGVRNIVIRHALGDYVVWVDADEILAPDFVRKQIGAIERTPNVGIVTGRLSILQDESLLRVLDLIPLVVDYSRQEWRHKYKLPGTGGATYRVMAAQQVNGFDENLTGLGEDIDIANRIRGAGWRIVSGDGVFYERHGRISTWRSLITSNTKQGVQSRQLYRKGGKFFSFSRMNPLASAVAGVLYAVRGYKVTRRKIVFLLPFHFSLKMSAWFYGFCTG